jgi:plasmid stability protein
VAQIFIPELDDAVEERLLRRALRHGRSLEAEACLILTEAAGEEPLERELREEGASMQGVEQPADEKGFGTLMQERFRKVGLTDAEWQLFNEGIEEFRKGDRFRPFHFDE